MHYKKILYILDISRPSWATGRLQLLCIGRRSGGKRHELHRVNMRSGGEHHELLRVGKRSDCKRHGLPCVGRRSGGERHGLLCPEKWRLVAWAALCREKWRRASWAALCREVYSCGDVKFILLCRSDGVAVMTLSSHTCSEVIIHIYYEALSLCIPLINLCSTCDTRVLRVCCTLLYTHGYILDIQ